MENIIPKEVFRNKNKFFLMDIRTEMEFAEGHIENSKNFSLENLPAYIEELEKIEEEIIIICRSGARAMMAFDYLKRLGIENIKVMEGGILNWEKHGLPLI